MKMNIAIIGKRFRNFATYIEENNYDSVFIEDSLIPLHSDQPLINVVRIDFSDTERVIETVKKLHETKSFDCVVTVYERYVEITSQIARELGLPAMSEQTAQACTDKSIMRKMFAKAPKKISPDFQLVSSLDDAKKFANTHTFPLILKPANLAKSLLVTKCSDIEELVKNYTEMMKRIESTYVKYAPLNTRKVIIEEFLDGSIHSVEAFIDGSGNPAILPYIVDYQTGYDIGFEDNFHYSRTMPSVLPLGVQKDFLETAEIAIRSLNMSNSAAHVEIIVTKDGPRIVEIGARNGGYREWMHKQSQGIDIFGNLLKSLTNKPFELSASRNYPSAVLELFPRNAGNFVGISNEENLRSLPSVKVITITYNLNDFMGKSSEGYKAGCIIKLHNTNLAQFEQDIEYINDHVYIETY